MSLFIDTPRMNVFIDTNVYLNFYHLSKEDLEELRKVFVLQQNEKVTLWLTDQVKYEYNRNRESKIADALKKFKEEKLNNQIPQMVKGYSEYHDLINAIKSYDNAKSKILERMKSDIDEQELNADKVIRSIFSRGNELIVDKKILVKAKKRFDRGNPPGKKGSYGDSINWVALLEGIPQNEDLHLISEDGDYFSPLNEDQLNGFLKDEWEAQKSSKIFMYKRLSHFMAKNFPQAKLATELEKEILIKELAESPAYMDTHRVLRRLSKISEFSSSQVNEIIKAYVENNQIYWIIEDEDVLDFAHKLLAQYKDVISEDNLSLLYELLPCDDQPLFLPQELL